jgi:hypothetical protein
MNIKHVSGGVASLLMLMSALTSVPAVAKTPDEESNTRSIRDRIASVQSVLMQHQDQVSNADDQSSIDSQIMYSAWGDRWAKSRHGSVWSKSWGKR